jgi:CubicO group peptidase (beta-lactamase class C family)
LAVTGLQALPPLPRLPLVPDPLRRIKVPRDLEAITTAAAEADPTEVGISVGGVRRIWEAVESLYRSGVHPAIALCVRRHGVVVLDRAIGFAHGDGPERGEQGPLVPATPQTPFGIFSASKAITATLVHLLDERGLLHIGDPVAEYLPDYGQHGKRGITIGQVLSHRAGVPNLPPEGLDLDFLTDPERIRELICQARPVVRPGRLLAYHAVSGGFILGEVVRAVTGEDIREVLRREILAPLGMRWTNYGVAPEDVALVARNHLTGLPLVPPLSSHLARVLSRPVGEVVELSNDPRFLTGVVPSANVVTTAGELARFFEVLRCGGELDGVRILQERTLRRALTEQSFLEVDLSLGFPTRFSYGFMLGAERLSLFGPDTRRAFGHLGFTNILGWADPERALSCALITTGKPVLYPEIARFWGVGWRVGREAAKVPPGS